MAKLKLELQGDRGAITLHAFVTAVEANLRMLADYDRALSNDPRGSLEWVVCGLSTGSLVVTAEGRTRVEGVNVGPAVVKEHVQGWRLIEQQGVTPPYLTEGAMRKAREMARLIGHQGVSGLVVSSLRERAAVTARASAHIEQLLPIRQHSIGSIEGTIETISIHGMKRFVVYHSRTRKAVVCRFENDEWIARAAEAMGRRVSVLGTVYSNAKGEPMRVDVERLRVLRSEEELPSIAALARSRPDFTGDLGTEEYIAEIRSA